MKLDRKDIVSASSVACWLVALALAYGSLRQVYPPAAGIFLAFLFGYAGKRLFCIVRSAH